MSVLCVLVVVSSVAAAVLWWRRHSRYTSTGIPDYPGAWPLLGHSLQVIGSRDCFDILIQKASMEAMRLNGVVAVWMGLKPWYIVTEPEIAYQLSNICMEKSYLYKFASSWIGEGLVTAPTSTWKAHRKLLNPTFNTQVLNGFMSIFNKQSQLIAEYFGRHAGNGEFDHLPLFTNIGIETVCQTAIGMPPRETSYFDNVMYSNAIDEIEKIVTNRMTSISLHPQFLYNLTEARKHEVEYTKILRGTASQVIAAKKLIKQEHEQNENKSATKCRPFLDLMLDLQQQGLLDDVEINDEVNTIIAAGYETTSLTLVFILTLLGSHKDVQNKLYNEIAKELGAEEKDVDKQDLSKLVYMEAVIKEALRVCPVVPFIARDVIEDTKIGNLTIPANSSVILSLWGLHNNKKLWGEDVNDFIPERWLDPSRVIDHPAAFAAFSFGRRNCIGKTYAFLLIKTTLVHVLRRFKIKSDISKLQTEFVLLMKPLSGHHISVEYRF